MKNKPEVSLNTRIGVAGCGTMGLPMAECLARAGYNVVGHDVRPLAEYADSSVKMIEDPREFANSVDILISVVRDIPQTEALLFGAQNIIGQPNPPSVVIVSSTLSPRFVTALRQQLPAHIELMDAPMSGAPYRARSGELSFMLGGAAETVTNLMPIFEVMGSRIFNMGQLGSGMTTKVLNNYCAAAGVVATRRALDMASALNLDQRELLGVMEESSGANWYASHIDDIDWSLEGYDRANTIGIVEKDVKSALDAVSADDVATGIEPCPLDDAILKTLTRLQPLKLRKKK